MPAPGKIRLIHFTPSFVSTFPVQVFAYTCAQNVSDRYTFFKTQAYIIVTALPYLQRDLQQHPEENEYRYRRFHRCCNSYLRGCCGHWVSHLWFQGQ